MWSFENDRYQRSEDGRQRTEDGRQRTETYRLEGLEAGRLGSRTEKRQEVKKFRRSEGGVNIQKLIAHS
jgi:hypothetical protein